MKTPSWRERIPGCFAFDAAPFGIHPYDRERAETMLRAAMCEGATWPEVIGAVRGYLQDRIPSPADVEDELNLVKRFRPNPFLQRSLGRAWLITLEDNPEISRCPREIISILNYRTSENSIRERMEQAYVTSFCDYFAKLSIARNRKNNVYSASFSQISGVLRGEAVRGVAWSGRIVCGAGPYLVARPVKNLRLEGAEARPQQLRWDEISPPEGTEITWPQSRRGLDLAGR